MSYENKMSCHHSFVAITLKLHRRISFDIKCRFEAIPKTETDRRLVEIDIRCRIAANHPAAMFDAEMCSFSAVSKANLPADFV